METLTKKERMRRALWRQPVDRLPVQTNYTGAMGAKLAAHFGCSVKELAARLDNHLLRVDVTHPHRLSADAKVSFDWWGAGWGTETEGYWHAHAPLAEAPDLATYAWPDPEAPALMFDAEKAIAADGGQHFITPNFGFALFERAWSLRGFDLLLMDLVEQPEWAEELLDRITDIQVKLARRFLALGVDGGYFGDDYGAQRSLLFSPKLWRRMMKPRLGRMFAVFREAGLPVILHSDGDIWPILPDLVDIGLTCLNPVQPEVLEHARLYREFGKHLSFYGGISTQEVLPKVTPAEVRAATLACIRELAPDGTGLILGPSHRMQSDIPPESVAAMLEAFPKAGAPASGPAAVCSETPTATSQRKAMLEAEFRQQFGAAPTLWVRAPGRVDLMGSHTDYNLGFVLTLPIGRDTWLAVRPRTDRSVRLFSLNLAASARFELDAISRLPGRAWVNYVAGVAATLQAAGYKLAGFDAVIHSTVPMNSGLSSSAALECAAATAFEALSDWKLDPVSKARLCQRAENEFVGVNCGILDQYTSCVGQEGCALLLDCRDLSSRPVKLAGGIAVLICDTKFKRELAGSEYGQRRAQCEEGARRLGLKALRDISTDGFRVRERELPPEVGKRCRFIVEENDRVLKLAAALQNFDRQAIRELSAASFRGACDLYEISVPAMQAMMDAMLAAPGVIGARQAGAGFGGCMVAFVERERVAAFAESVTTAYHQATGIQPQVSTVEAAAGAGVIAN
jgi:galactokinase